MKLSAFENSNFQLRLVSLERYFAAIPDRKIAEEDNVYLLPIKKCQSQLKRFDKQVVFFGVFKAGKSTLLNAILGSPLLPSRTNRATGVVTKIGYSHSRTARVIQRSSTISKHKTLDIKPDQIGQYILLDISQAISKAPEEIETVEVGLPLPLLNNGWCLIDTPGLLDNQALTERTYQQLEQTDLAVMVLAADKLLTQAEKEAAQRVHSLLNGNIIFILNRVGLIDSENLAEVIDWATTSLEGTGNKLIGKSTIFATDAKQILNAKQQSDSQQQDIDSLIAFENWLQALLNSPTGERVFLLSRLGILEYHLSKAQIYFQLQLARTSSVCNKKHWMI
jgi:GTPase SAR1 family protein